MLIDISKLLNIKKEETTRIILLVSQSLFYGIFISYYTSYINALFLSVFSISYLSIGYLASGFVGIILAYIFSWSIKKISFNKVSIATLLLIILFLLIVKLFINAKLSIKSIAFIGFIFYTPIASLIALLFGNISIKLFNLQQSKRLFSLISTGAVVAAILSYLTVPILISFFNDSSDLLWCSIFGIFVSGIIQTIINSKYTNNINESKQVVHSEMKAQKVSIFKSPYFKRIYIVSVLSMIGVILVSYSFLSASKIFFNDYDIKTLGKFFGLFFGITKSIEFIMNTFISGKLLEKNGLKFGLSSLPISLLTLSSLSLILSIISNSSRNLESIIFILVVLNMLLLIVVKRSFEDSSFKLLFQPINLNIKTIIQSNTEGKARQLGSILAGILLVIIQYSIDSNYLQITCISLIVFNCVIWYINVNKVSLEYKKYISDELKKIKKDKIKEVNFTKSLFYLKNLEITAFTKYIFPGIEFLTNSKSKNFELIDNKELSRLCNNKIEYIDLMKSNWSRSYFNELLFLIEDKNPIVSSYLVYSLKNKILSNEFKEFINCQKNEFTTRLLILLELIDFDFSESNDKILYNLSKNNDSNLTLLDIISNSSWSSSSEILLKSLDFRDPEIEYKIITILKKNTININKEKKYLIKNKIIDEVSKYTWTLASLIDIGNTESCLELSNLLNSELKSLVYRIFNLTSLIYDKNEIEKIINIIREKKSNRIILAVELVDLIIDEDLKEYLIPIIDSLSNEEKLQKLSKLSPQIKMNLNTRLRDILNSEFDKVNIIIRLETIQLLNLFERNTDKAILANIFNTETVLCEAAYSCLYKSSKIEFDNYLKKEVNHNILPIFNRDALDYHKNYLVVFDRLHYIKKSTFFNGISELELVKVLKISNYIYETNLKNKDTCFSGYLVIDGLDIIKQNNDKYHLSTIKDFLIIPPLFEGIVDLENKVKLLKIDFQEMLNIAITSKILFSRFT